MKVVGWVNNNNNRMARAIESAEFALVLGGSGGVLVGGEGYGK